LETHQSSITNIGERKINAHFVATLFILDGLTETVVELNGITESEFAHAQPKSKLRRESQVKIATIHVRQSEKNVLRVSLYFKARRKLNHGLMQLV